MLFILSIKTLTKPIEKLKLDPRLKAELAKQQIKPETFFFNFVL